MDFMKHVALTLTMGLALGVSGCSDEAEETEAFCTSFGAGATYQWTACTAGCIYAQPALAYDSNLVSSATIVPLAGQSTYTAVLTATAPADIPGGADVGVFITQPNNQNFQTMNSTLRTIRDGVQQEALIPGGANDVTSDSQNGTQAAGYLGMRTTLAFDQVEFTATVTWTGTQVPNYSVFEICADGGNV
jgi:hypothetical protein